MCTTESLYHCFLALPPQKLNKKNSQHIFPLYLCPNNLHYSPMQPKNLQLQMILFVEFCWHKALIADHALIYFKYEIHYLYN